MKTQWPRSADEPGVYMAQTGTSTALAWAEAQQAGGGTGLRAGLMETEPFPFFFLPVD